MFIGRTRELASLQEQYDQSGFTMSVIYGRRRIGKSTLISEFIAGKRSIYYMATKVGADRNLELFTRQVLSVLEPDLQDAVFPTLDSVLDLIGRRLTDEKLVLVIDELPYWAEKDESILSVFQKYIDTAWQNQNLMLILCGSTLSFMENKVLSEKSPLFGRRTSQIRLEPFDYREAARFVPNYSVEDQAICYGVTGGVAKYLAMMDASRSLDDNIRRLFFRTDGYMYDEVRNLLTQEFSDITIVNNVIEQIAAGHRTLGEIADGAKEIGPTVSYTLGRLIEVGLVDKKNCITEEKNHKKTQYVLKDTMFQFWYTFIPKAVSVIEMGHGDLYYDKVVRPSLHSFMGSVFEEMCRRYVLEQGVTGHYGVFLTRVGTWWGMENITDADGAKHAQPADIDVVAVSDPDRSMIIGECKFRNERIDKDVVETLIRRADILQGRYKVVGKVLFSLRGYTKWCMEEAPGDVELLTLEDLYTEQ